MGNTIGDIKKVQNDIKSSIKNTWKEVQEFRQVNEQLQAQITDLQARSMSNNLLFLD
jgi:prefoldin subunit 5